MPTPNDFPARGRIIETKPGLVVFKPLNTNYQLHLAGSCSGPADQRIDALIRVKGKKVWTVPNGGNFIAPIFGPPRMVQGRIKHLEDRLMVVQAGTPVIVELPEDERAYDIVCGPLAVGVLVNVTCFPQAAFEPCK